MAERDQQEGITKQRDRYVDAVFERAFTRHPSGAMLDRAEGVCSTPEQALRLIEYLIGQVEASRYPSRQLMDRLDRILFGAPARQRR
jgi:hypothetical protein